MERNGLERIDSNISESDLSYWFFDYAEIRTESYLIVKDMIGMDGLERIGLERERIGLDLKG